MTRRKFLRSLAATAAVSLVYPCYVEPRWLDVTRHTVVLNDDIKDQAASSPIRIVQLSDLHASLCVPPAMIDHAVTVALAQKPDIVCLTGDFITRGQEVHREEYVPILRRLRAGVSPVGLGWKALAPVFAVLGNHDGGAWAGRNGGLRDHRLVESILEESGIELLHNRAIQLQIRDARFTLAGVGDLWSAEVDPERAFAGVDESRPIVLMAHNPDTKDFVADYPWNLMLSGHTHGGQVIVPFAGPVFAPVADKRYVSGLKPWGSRQIHVTHGVGNIRGVRFRCRPEVNVLDLV